MNILGISREEFREIYAGLPVLKLEDKLYAKIEDADDFYGRLKYKLFRMNMLYTITNKRMKPVIFKMNRSQHIVFAQSLRHPRLVILKSRQQGISTLYLVMFMDDAFFKPHQEIGLMLQDLQRAKKMLERVKLLWETFDPNIKKELGNLRDTANNESSLTLSNHSSITVGTSFRSGTLSHLHISEMGAIANRRPDWAKETQTGSLQAIAPENPCVIESTAKGDNLFKHMWDNAVKNENALTIRSFKPVFLPWHEDPHCVLDAPENFSLTQTEEAYLKSLELDLTQEQKNFWAFEHRQLGKEVYQEYPANPEEAFRADQDGNYYTQHFKHYIKDRGRIKDNLYDEYLPVQTAWDLGMDGYTVIVFFQAFQEANEPRPTIRIIDEFVDRGYDLKYYVEHIKHTPYVGKLINNILPHDVEVKELSTGKSRKSMLMAHGLDKIKVLPAGNVADGIEAVKEHMKFMYIDKKCEYIISVFNNHKKEWDNMRQHWKAKEADTEWSHGADALRYMVEGGMLRKTEHFRHDPRHGVMI